MLLHALASAALATTVTFQPDLPITGRGTGQITLSPSSADFPAGESFTLSIPVANSELRGTAHVWPQAVASCKGGVPDSGDQVYQLPLVMASDNKKLEATVPALQVHQQFCVSIDLTWPLPESDWKLVTTRVVDTLLAPGTNGNAACTPDEVEERLHDALARELAPWNISAVARDEAVAAAKAEYQAGAWQAACVARTKAITKVIFDERELAVQTALLATLRGALPAAAPTATVGSPIVFVDGHARPLAPLASDPAVTNAQLTQALGQISTGSAPDRSAWIAAIQKVIYATTADRPAALAQLRKVADTAKSAPIVLYASSGSRVDIPTWLAQPGGQGLPLPTALTQVGELSVASVDGSPARRDLGVLERALTTYKDELDNYDRLAAAQKTNSDAATAADTTLRTFYLSILQKDTVRGPLTVSALPIVVKPPDTGYLTDSVYNYAAVQTGVAAAFPSLGTKDLETPFSAVPYVAVNLYFTPVDRKIELDKLVGATFFQHVSLLAGAAIGTNPIQVSGREAKTALGDFYPIVGASVRVRHYMNISGGTVLFRLADASPASGEAPIRPAPFIGVSFDADLAKLLTDAVN